MTMDEADMNGRKIAYIDTIRGLHRRKREAGFIGCLIGVLLLVVGRFSEAAPDWTVWLGLAVVIASWALFAFVIFARMAYVRAHPFDPGS